MLTIFRTLADLLLLVMVLVKLQFSGSDFDLHIIDPYMQLKKGFARAKTSVLDKTIFTWKADAVWTAFINGRIAVGASTLSVSQSVEADSAVCGSSTDVFLGCCRFVPDNSRVRLIQHSTNCASRTHEYHSFGQFL